MALPEKHSHRQPRQSNRANNGEGDKGENTGGVKISARFNFMKPIKMSKQYGEHAFGDCYRAAMASMLELPLSEMPIVPVHLDEFSERLRKLYAGAPKPSAEEIVPHLGKWLEETRDRFTKEFNAAWLPWFGERNLIRLALDPPIPPGYCVALCRYKEFSHALVCYNEKVVFDPDPLFDADRPEVPWEIQEVHVIVPRDPSVLLKK